MPEKKLITAPKYQGYFFPHLEIIRKPNICSNDKQGKFKTGKLRFNHLF